MPPKYIFIIPYRDREQHLQFFNRHMKYVLEDVSKDDYEIYFVHQCDSRKFNRGAMKNIGFLAIRDKYPNDYKNITLVFNDIDTMPFQKNNLNYETVPGVIKHFYGYKFALGGIVSVTGQDFERMNGFPNFWAWGYEDNELQNRATRSNITVDRSQFYPIADRNIIQFNDGLIRNVNRTEFDRFKNNTKEGWNSISDVTYSIDESNGFINVSSFDTGFESVSPDQSHDLRKGNVPFPDIKRYGGGNPRMQMFM
jgi:hypothetical protein